MHVGLLCNYANLFLAFVAKIYIQKTKTSQNSDFRTIVFDWNFKNHSELTKNLRDKIYSYYMIL